LDNTYKNTLDRLAGWVSALTPEKPPAAVQLIAQTCLIDTVGVAIAGSATDVSRSARAVAIEGGSQGQSSIFGSGQLFSAPAAAFANGAAAHALDFDDNCYAGFVHGSAVIVPAALAVAQKVNASGPDLITAVVAGAECEYAVGAASMNRLYDQGWWTTGVLGPIGSCVAAAYLLKLNRAAIRSALGLAMAGAGGAKACFGSDAKALLAGRASEAGVVCALLAAQGAIGPGDAIEHKNGFINLFNGGAFDFDALDALDGADPNWLLAAPGVDVKRIPVCLSSHAAVDAVMTLVAEHRIDLTEIESIVCDVPPIVVANLVYDLPRNRQEAQFSMPFAIAASLQYGSVRLEHLDNGVIGSQALAALMPRISMATGPRWDDEAARKAAPEGAHVRITLRDGAAFELFSAFFPGAAGRPLGAREIKDKFLGCAAPVLGHAAAKRLLSRLDALGTAASVRGIFS
jgi:2-methylcitrate dehydratase PrpD